MCASPLNSEQGRKTRLHIGGYPSGPRPLSDFGPPPDEWIKAMNGDHECVFVEEQEPSGRLILPPCIVCGMAVLDALEQLRGSA